MQISTKSRYGLRALVDLAVYSNHSHISLKVIAERQDISANYLEGIFSTLRKAGLIKSIKGTQGGYILGDTPANITLGAILRTLEGDLSIIDKTTSDDLVQDDIDQLIQKVVWKKINQSINTLVDSITLEDLMNDYNRLRNGTFSMFYI